MALRREPSLKAWFMTQGHVRRIRDVSKALRLRDLNQALNLGSHLEYVAGALDGMRYDIERW